MHYHDASCEYQSNHIHCVAKKDVVVVISDLSSLQIMFTIFVPWNHLQQPASKAMHSNERARAKYSCCICTCNSQQSPGSIQEVINDVEHTTNTGMAMRVCCRMGQGST